MAICQNEAEVTEAIREAKAHCGAAIREAEACCAADIREAESHCVDHAPTIQQSHSNNMQCLEREAIEEGGKLPILPSCLWDGLAGLPPTSARCVNVSSPIANGEHVLGHPPGHSPQMPTVREESTPVTSCSTTPAAPMPSPGTK